MKDYALEVQLRVEWISQVLIESGARGIIFGSSGGKDSALVGILCRMATENTLGVIMPCESRQNYAGDTDHATTLGIKFGIQTITVDLTPGKKAILTELEKLGSLPEMASANINPRLRMATLYALGQSRGYLVAGTGNRSEYYTGYFTKWGDGAYDFNPIADLLATEVSAFLKYLEAPPEISEKPPSAGLFEGQTDESEMGVSYADIDSFIQTGLASPHSQQIIEQMHKRTVHKRIAPKMYGIQNGS